MLHGQHDIGSNCPGDLEVARVINTTTGPREVYRCPLCLWSNDPARKQWQVHESKRPQFTSPAEPNTPEDRPMRITVSANRKISTTHADGRPDYGTIDSTIAFEIVLSDEMTPELAMQTALVWSQTAELTVERDIARRAAHIAEAQAQESHKAATAMPARTNGHATPAANGRRFEVAAPSRAEPDPPYADDVPRSGKELLQWSRRMEMDDKLFGLAKAWKLGMIRDLGQDDVDALYRELTTKAAVHARSGRN